jgi:hypothetical protein
MVKESILGKMEESLMVTTIWIKSMVMEYIFGLMEENMKANGRMGNNMAKVNTHQQMVK